MRFIAVIMLLSSLSFAQSRFDRMNLVSIKEFQGNITDSTKIIVIEKDTLVDQSNLKIKEFNLSSKMDNDKILYDYYYMTAQDKKASLVFWKTPIVIYMSDDFAKEIKDDLKLFVEEINTLNTVQISFTDSKEKSNLLILNHNSIPRYYGEKFLKDLSPEEIQYLLFKNSMYSLFRVDSTINSGYIRIALDKFNDSQGIKNQLRRILYASLGFFIDSGNISEQSMLFRRFKKAAMLNEYDKKLLQIHYDHLSDFKVTSYEMYQLYANRK